LFDSAGTEELPRPADEEMKLINNRQQGMLFFNGLLLEILKQETFPQKT
jgi:hypothetical protein